MLVCLALCDGGVAVKNVFGDRNMSTRGEENSVCTGEQREGESSGCVRPGRGTLDLHSTRNNHQHHQQQQQRLQLGTTNTHALHNWAPL